jgi:hypothetical protein
LLRWRHRFRFRQRGSTPQTWVKGGYAPLLYSRKAVEAATETLIRLTPGR